MRTGPAPGLGDTRSIPDGDSFFLTEAEFQTVASACLRCLQCLNEGVRPYMVRDRAHTSGHRWVAGGPKTRIIDFPTKSLIWADPPFRPAERRKIFFKIFLKIFSAGRGCVPRLSPKFRGQKCRFVRFHPRFKAANPVPRTIQGGSDDVRETKNTITRLAALN